MLQSLRQHYTLYLMEAFGLFIFMVSACFFSAMLEHPGSRWHMAMPNPFHRLLVMGLAMGVTALFIFLSPLTSPSGAFINPAVTFMRYRLGQIGLVDCIWYSIFQTLGGLVAVYIMALLMGTMLTTAPVNYAVTVPGKNVTTLQAAAMETITGFVMIAMVLFTSENDTLKKYTAHFAACLVSVYVIMAGPVSGFGMNPARTIASALPAGIYTAFWIYMLCPFIGMLGAAELFLQVGKK